MILKKAIQNYWEVNVPGIHDYEAGLSAVDYFRFYREPYIPFLLDSIVSRGGLILEIGCGFGTDSRYMSRRGARVISLDIGLGNVKKAVSGEECGNIGINADAEDLPFKDNVFDTVYSYGCLHHTPDTQGAIHEIYRVLKPGGKCLVMLYHKGYAYYFLLLRHGWKRLSPLELTSNYDHTPR